MQLYLTHRTHELAWAFLIYFNVIMECLEMSLKVCGVFSCGVVTVPTFQHSVPIPVKTSKTQKHTNKKNIFINKVKIK